MYEYNNNKNKSEKIAHPILHRYRAAARHIVAGRTSM